MKSELFLFYVNDYYFIASDMVLPSLGGTERPDPFRPPPQLKKYGKLITKTYKCYKSGHL